MVEKFIEMKHLRFLFESATNVGNNLLLDDETQVGPLE